MGLRTTKIFLSACSLVLFGCGGGGGSDSAPAGPTVVAELEYCTSSSAVTTPTTLTATAQFQARVVSTSGLGAAGAAQPIRYAEVQVLDSAGNTVQCGATDATGSLVETDLVTPLKIPRVAGDYTLKVNSRANNSKIAVSILNNPTSNGLFSVTGSFSLTGSETTKAVTLSTAPATGTLEGGAFNILDQVYLANEFLRSNSACPASEAGCAVFTVAPKIKIFWAPGVDPGTSYLGLGYPISAYLRSTDANYKGLYILGGKDGDFDCTDTDHFDNSIVLHEYGHFLEEYFALSSDSPGGSHSGNGLIDPRLAWSEGWANFFQAAVYGSPYYRDTIRNSDCSSATPATKLQINLTFYQKTNRQDVPTFVNEGIFRETSVSRSLYQAISAPSGLGKGASIGFNYIWRVFTDSTFGGMSATTNHFRNIGMFNEFLYDLVNANDAGKIAAADPAGYNNVLAYEEQPHDTSGYATPLSAGACGAHSITGGNTRDEDAASGAPLSPSYTTASLQQNSRFFSYYWNGTGTFSVKLAYSKASLAAADVDLYVYNESHSLFDTTSMLGYSAQAPASEVNEGGGFYSETVTATAAAGTYLIHVYMDESSPYSGVTSNFTLTTGAGATLCP